MSAPPTGKGEPITGKSQLIEWLAAGCKPASAFRIGTEHEKFGFTTDDLRPLPYDGPRGIRALLDGLQSLRLGAGAGGRPADRSAQATAAASRWSRAASSSCPARRWRPCTRPAARCIPIWTR